MLLFLKKKKKRQIIWQVLGDRKKLEWRRYVEMLCTIMYLYRSLFFFNSAWFDEISENLDHRKLTCKQTEVHRELRSSIRAEENDLWQKTEWFRLVYLVERKLRAKCRTFQIHLFYPSSIAEDIIPDVNVSLFCGSAQSWLSISRMLVSKDIDEYLVLHVQQRTKENVTDYAKISGTIQKNFLTLQVKNW